MYEDPESQLEQLYRTSEVARMIGVSAPAILRWHRCGWIPKATHSLHGRRLYSEVQVMLLQSIANREGTNARKQQAKIVSNFW
jgi:DNA-binding transcriptional MerR regulator